VVSGLFRGVTKGWFLAVLALVGSMVFAPVQTADAAGRRAAATAKKAHAQPVVKAKAHKRVKASRADVRRSAAHRSRRVSIVHAEPPRPSFGEAFGLHTTVDPLDLRSSVALVVDQETSEVLFSKNSRAVLPIASLTKLMTAVVVLDANLPMDELLEISDADIDTEKGSRSRLRPGLQLSRSEMLHLALMASENRAANALGRHYPGGMGAFVAAMNAKARQLGMHDTFYVEPTGLSSRNQSSATDLAALAKAAYRYPAIRELSTSPEAQVELGARTAVFHNTNRLVNNPSWAIGLQKTGYIAEAGRCLVMQAHLAGRKLIMVFLDSAGKYSRLGDAERVRRWLEGESTGRITLRSTQS
jgi:serine-type D-Ala-D-Ala endopeptidase (penicillin-binding protein 7)